MAECLCRLAGVSLRIHSVLAFWGGSINWLWVLDFCLISCFVKKTRGGSPVTARRFQLDQGRRVDHTIIHDQIGYRLPVISRLYDKQLLPYLEKYYIHNKRKIQQKNDF